MRTHGAALIIFTSMLYLTGCSELENWTRERKYTYYHNYSTQDLVGLCPTSKGFDTNYKLRVTQTGKADLPDYQVERDGTFSLTGSAKVNEFLGKLAPASAEAAIAAADHVEFTLEKPFQSYATQCVPIATVRPGSKERVTFVNNALNTGKLKLKVVKKGGGTMAGDLKFPEGTEASGDVAWSYDKTTVTVGEGYFTGYQTETRELSLEKSEHLRIGSGKQGNIFGGEIILLTGDITPVRQDSLLDYEIVIKFVPSRGAPQLMVQPTASELQAAAALAPVVTQGNVYVIEAPDPVLRMRTGGAVAMRLGGDAGAVLVVESTRANKFTFACSKIHMRKIGG